MTMMLSDTFRLTSARRKPRAESTGVDAGLRGYTRAFAAPLVPLAVVGAVLALAMWLAQVD
jgi:hypothetical protein